MNQQLWDIVNDARDNGYEISDEYAEKIYQLCLRKMSIAGIKENEEYLVLMYIDELKNYCIRNVINNIAEILKDVAEVIQNV